ncbi:4978_t:CDS:2, partial [Cetraspora pellucida]
SKPPLRNIEKNNNLFEDNSQVMNVEITENKRKKISNRTNVKKKKENEELCLTDSDNDITQAVGGSHSHSRISKNIQPQSEQASNASSPSIRSPLPENFYDQHSLTSKISQSPLAERHLPESVYSQLSPTPNVTPSSLTRNYSFRNTVNQWSSASTTSKQLTSLPLSMINADGQESVITQGKFDKFSMLPERDLGMLQMHLKYLFFRIQVINKQIIDALIRSLFSDIQHAGVLERAALQRWVFGCYRDYNAALRHELRKLAPEFIRKHKLTKVKQPTIQQISEYITERNWAAFLKCHIDVTDVQRTFRDRPENIEKFTNFIQSSFNLFVQEILLDKDVIDDVKNLNYITVDMEIFMADRKDSLQQLDLRGECSQNTVSQALQNTVSQASQVSINGDDSGESLQENFSDNESLLSDKSQHTNDLEYNFSMASDTSSSSDQLSVTEEIELQTEEEKNFNQIIVDSGIDFQPLPG